MLVCVKFMQLISPSSPSPRGFISLMKPSIICHPPISTNNDVHRVWLAEKELPQLSAKWHFPAVIEVERTGSSCIPPFCSVTPYPTPLVWLLTCTVFVAAWELNIYVWFEFCVTKGILKKKSLLVLKLIWGEANGRKRNVIFFFRVCKDC